MTTWIIVGLLALTSVLMFMFGSRRKPPEKLTDQERAWRDMFKRMGGKK